MNLTKARWIKVGIVTLVFLLIYLSGVFYFQGRFLPGTKVGGTSIAGMTLEQAPQHLSQRIQSATIDIYENEQILGQLALANVTSQSDFGQEIQEIAANQSAWAWPLRLLGAGKVNAALSDQALVFDKDQLIANLNNLGVTNSNRTPSTDAYIKDDGTGFTLVSETQGNQIDLEMLEEFLRVGLSGENLHIDLNQLYKSADTKMDDPALNEDLAYLNKIISNTITLTFDGREVTIPKDKLYQWVIYTDGLVQIDRQGIEDYIRELNQTYAGLFLGRNFESTYYGTVWVEPGTYGWYIDRIAETDLLAQEILAGDPVNRPATIGGSGYGMGDSVGASYVEVSITAQMMWIYHDGQLVLETPVVTGLPGTNTIPGAYQVWNMESPSVLVGYNPHTNINYQQPVDYWIAFDDQAQGIHDANWQPYFGGDAYLTSGSLGCINTPPGIMPQVFALVYHGMPVIIY
ncbi:TPA: L,D-transpeptidase [Streptococcus suis]